MPRSKKAISTRKKLPIVDKIILVLNILAAAMLLLSYLAPGTDPRDSSFIAIMGFGFQPLILANFCSIIYWLFRKKALALISSLSIIVGIYYISLNFGFRLPTPVGKKEATSDIRFMTYNVHEFKAIDRYESADVKANIIQLIKEKQPDILNFVEYRVNKDEKGSIKQYLTDTLNYKYHYFNASKVFKGDSIGVIMFSKFPIIKADTLKAAPILNLRGLYADIKHNNKTFRVYGLHLAYVEIKGNEKSKIMDGKINLDNSSLITSKLTVAFIKRSFQVSQIKKDIEKCPYPYIIAGDFNDTPISYAVNELGDGIKNAFAEKGSGLVSTYYSSFPKLQIDHILVSGQFDVLNYETIDKKLSDHKPVISDLKLN
jgi:endonuclease/exonuclease/phosphatase family metal-dependent hydrolase